MYKVENTPLVTVVLPTTTSRDKFVKRYIDCFLSQDYQNKELAICQIRNSNDFDIYDRLYLLKLKKSARQKIKTIACRLDGTIGEQRNNCVAYTSGEIILHMDDDDIYKPDWITKSVEALISSKADIVGLSSYYAHKVQTDEVFSFERQDMGQLYLPEATLCYWRKTWERKPFLDTSAGEGLDFITNNGRLFAHGYKDGFLATRHGGNTIKYDEAILMKKQPQNEAARIIKSFYGGYFG